MSVFTVVICKNGVRDRSRGVAKLARSILMLSLLVGLLTCVSSAQLKQPGGVYAKVLIDELVAKYTGPPEGLHDCLRHTYQELLAPPAVQGLTVGEHWDKIQITDSTYPDGYDFSFLDDAFEAAHAAGKSIRLVLTPGFDTPKWLLHQLKDCTFVNKKLTGPCGKQQFSRFPEEARSDGDRLPLPWNGLYKSKWKAFLNGINAKYGGDSAFIAIALAGPVAGSDEMILPTNLNDKHTQPSGLNVNDTWEALIKMSFPTRSDYVDSDQVFVDQWKDAIDDYAEIFTNVTVFLGVDAGGDLPEFPPSIILPPPVDPNSWQAIDCETTGTPMSCHAKTDVLTYLIGKPGTIGKATQVGGMIGASQTTNGNIGVPGVKLLTSLQPSPTPIPTPILGGAAFDLPVSDPRFTQKVGCLHKKNCPPLSVEAAAGNVLAVFFDQTPFSSTFLGAQGKNVSNGLEPIHYLDVPYTDVQYAETHPCEVTTDASGTQLTTIGKSFMDQINDADYALLTMSNKPIPLDLPPLGSSTCTGTVPDKTPPVTTVSVVGTTGTNGWYTAPVDLDFTATDNASAIAETDYSLDGGTTWKQVECNNLYLIDGVYDVTYRSIDGADNSETSTTIHLMIDSVAPTTTITSVKKVKVGGVTQSVIITFTAADDRSGVARTEYSKDNGATWIPVSSRIILGPTDPDTILYRSVDVAGNVEGARSITVNF